VHEAGAIADECQDILVVAAGGGSPFFVVELLAFELLSEDRFESLRHGFCENPDSRLDFARQTKEILWYFWTHWELWAYGLSGGITWSSLTLVHNVQSGDSLQNQSLLSDPPAFNLEAEEKEKTDKTDKKKCVKTKKPLRDKRLIAYSCPLMLYSDGCTAWICGLQRSDAPDFAEYQLKTPMVFSWYYRCWSMDGGLSARSSIRVDEGLIGGERLEAADSKCRFQQRTID
jgi:hypothetical protein